MYALAFVMNITLLLLLCINQTTIHKCNITAICETNLISQHLSKGRCAKSRVYIARYLKAAIVSGTMASKALS